MGPGNWPEMLATDESSSSGSPTIYKIYLLLDTIGLSKLAGDIPCQAQRLWFAVDVVLGTQDKAILLDRIRTDFWLDSRRRDGCKVVDWRLCGSGRDRARLLVVLRMVAGSWYCSGGAAKDVEHKQREQNGKEATGENKDGIVPSTATVWLWPGIHGGGDEVSSASVVSALVGIAVQAQASCDRQWRGWLSSWGQGAHVETG